MKNKPQSSRSLRGILHALAISLATLVLIPQAARAATITKANNTENLNLSASWTGGAVPGTADIAQWTSTVTATNPTVLGADLSLAGVSIVNPGGLVTINSGNTLTIGTSGIDLSTATQDLTINSGLTLLGKQSWKAAAGRTLTVGGTFTRTGSMVDFTSFNATATLTGLTNEASGILGPWATTGSETSMNYVKSTAGAISAYTGQTPSALSDLSDVTNAGVNYSFATASSAIATLSAPITANTLLYTGTGTQSSSAIANNGKTITVNGLMGNSTARFMISGTGNLMIGANKELVCNYVTAYSGTTCPIVNYNDGSSHVSSVTINLNRASGGEFNWGNTSSTYSGGTTINNLSSNTMQFNITSGASAAFGTGPITLNGNNITLRPSGTTFANNITINKNSGVTVRNNSGTTTFNGNITLDSSIIFANAGSNQSETLNGNVTGAGGITLTQPNLGCVVFLTGTNTYTGPTAVNNGLLKAGRASMANVSGAFGLNSAVTMANSANARIDLNSFDTQIGSLTGGGTTGGNVINSHASIAATLTVGGNNTSPAAYAGLVSGSRLALTKIGIGKQILSGANTYTGDTVVQNGTLTLSPTVAGGYLADAADVKLYTGGILELNTSSTDTIRSLYIDGVPQAIGEWGSATSGAANQSPLFTGTGKLNVGTPGSALTYSISGKVTLSGTGLAGVTVSDGTRSATTASDGTYTIASVPDNATYTVTANTLTPSSVVVTVKGANVTGNNYTAPVVAGSITLTGPLGAVNTTYGTASATPTSFTVSATGLTPASGNLAVAALSGYEYSTTSGGTYSSTLSLPYTGSALSSTSVFVRLAKAASVGSSPYSGNISVSGGGATVATIAAASSTVSAASLTISANNQNKPFGTTQATPVSGSNAFTAIGLQNGETVGSVSLIYGNGGLLDTDPVGSTSTITPSAATGGTFTAGNYSITYSADSGTLTVYAPPTKLAYKTVPATGTAGTAFSVTVEARDSGDTVRPVSSDTTVTLSQASGGGTLSGTLTGIIPSGSTEVTISTPVYSKSDTMTLTATPTLGMTGLTPLTSGNIAFTPGALDHFTITPTITSPQTAGTPITGLTLTALDAYGNTCDSGVNAFNGTVTYSGTAGITGTSGAFTAGVLSGASVTPTVAGSGKTFIVTGSTKTGTSTFDVNSGVASALLITTPPSGGQPGVAWATQPTVKVLDAVGNIVSNSVASITLTITSGTPASGGIGGSTLSGTTTVAAVNGVATFSGLSIDKAGVGYRLTASSGVLPPADSALFSVTAGTVLYDSTACSGNFPSKTLNFTPVAGHVYTLSFSLNNPTNSVVNCIIGLSPNNLADNIYNAYTLNDGFWNSSGGNIKRQYNGAENGTAFTSTGSGNGYRGSHGVLISNYEVVLDTTAETWKTSTSMSSALGTVSGAALNAVGTTKSVQVWVRDPGNSIYPTISNFRLTETAVIVTPTYASWATTNSVSSTPSADSNSDGVQNGVAYFMNATGVTTNPGIIGNAVTWPNGGNIPSTEYGTQFVVQTSLDLVNWADVESGDLTTNTSGPSGALTYTLPASVLGGKLFTRLVITPN